MCEWFCTCDGVNASMTPILTSSSNGFPKGVGRDHGRVQQRPAEQSEDAPQSPAEVVEAVTLVPREQAQQRTSLTDQEKQLLHSLRNMDRSVRCEVSRSCVTDMSLRHGCGKDLLN